MPNIQQVSFTSPYAADEAEILRRQQMAQALQAQSMQPLGDTQMAGGVAIRRSPLEGLAQMGKAASASAQLRDVDERRRALQERQQQDLIGDTRALVAGLRGRPAGMDEDAAGNVTPMPEIRAGQLDPGVIGQLRTPMMQQAALQQIMAGMLRSPNDMLAKINPKDYTPQSFQQFMQSGNPAALQAVPEYATVGNNLVPKPVSGQVPAGGLQPVYTAPEKDEAAKFNAILTGAGIDPTSPQGQALFKSLAMKTATHQPPNQVVTNVSTEKKYGEQFAGQIAQADAAMRDAAIKAPDLAERSNNVRKLLSSGNVITGTGADFRLQFAKAAQLAGIGNGTASDTEQVATSLAQNTLDAIKASGLGSGSGFSNADRDFLEKAVGGKINLERQTIEKLAELSHRAATKSADKWNTRVREIPSTALEGTGVKRDEIKVPELFRGKGGAPVAGAVMDGYRFKGGNPADKNNWEPVR